MKIEQLLEVLLEKNIFLKANLGELEIDAPDGIVNEILLQEIKNNKEGLIELLQESVKSFSIPLESKKDVYLLSNAQRRLWILDQFEQDSIAYNMPMSFILEGKLKTDAFRQAYSFMLERHESLRTVFVVKDGKPRQKILKNPGFDIDIIDLRNSLDVENEAGVLAEKDHQTPFNLNTGPLIRYTILQLEDEKFLLLFNMHHIISDEWSMDIFIKEFLISYESFKEGNTPELAPLRIHYKDYSAWQNNLLDSHEMENQREYWLGKLSGELPFLDLPTDNVRPDTQTFNGKSFGFFLTEEKNSRLNDLCLENKASLFMMLQALVKVLFYRYTGQTDIILGSPVAGRVHGELENQIGFYVNTLILRDTIENHLTFNKFLKSVKKTCTDAYDNQDYPFDKLVDELDIKRDMSHSPLFDIMVVLQNNDEVFDELDGLILSPYSIENTISKFDMTFNFSERGEGLFCSIEYNTDIYSVDRIKRMAKHLEILISSVIENPESRIKDLDIIPEEERNLLLNVFNKTKIDYPVYRTIVDLFEEQVEKTPDNIAVVFEDIKLTYRELNEKANIVGNYLKDNYNIQPDDLVGVFLERSEKMIIALWGILKSGAAYVPIDPGYPEERINYILNDSKPKAIISDRTNKVSININDILQSEAKISNPEGITSPASLVYVIYTSGSTGNPKGTLIEHRSLVNRLDWMQRNYTLDNGDSILLKTTYTFDVSVWELFWWSLYGAKVCILSPGGQSDPELIINAIEKHSITTIHFVPSMFNVFLQYLDSNKSTDRIRSLKHIFSSGEELTVDLVKRGKKIIEDNGTKLINLYGPTEATIDVTYYNCDNPSDTIPIGKPISNTNLYIIDKENELTPLGIPGELCISGICLAREYLNNPELTTEKFVDNPFVPGERMYRTGDLARWLPDGNIEYLGRMDNQVKIRGFRIELGEIENSLVKYDKIMSSVVLARNNLNSDKHLIAYYVSVYKLDSSDLKSFLGESLPEYMVPSIFIHLEKLPLTSNGKIDRNMLPDPDGVLSPGIEYVAPGNYIEKELVLIWQKVLHIKRIGIMDNFFDLGGNSLRAITLIASIGKKLNLNLDLNTLFKHPTIKQIAEKMENSEENIQLLPDLECNKADRFKPFPLTDIQQAYWIGRTDHFELGNIGTHGYSELFLTDLDIDKFNHVLNILIERHEMLRMVVTEDGQQQILEYVEPYQVKILDLRGLNNEEETKCFLELRDELSHQIFKGDSWPLFDIRITIFSDGTYKLHYSMDALVMDGASNDIFYNEFALIYMGKSNSIPELDVSFRDYVVAEQEIKKSTLYNKSKKYWLDRIETLSGKPELPLAKNPFEIVNPKFVRKEFYIDRLQWKRLEKGIKKIGVTPTVFFIEVFARIIENWSRNSNFLLNLTLFNRIPLHEDINRIIGDFTSLTLLEMDYRDGVNFSSNMRSTQDRLWDDLENRYFSGVEVQREMSQIFGETISIPVVVTSTLGNSIYDISDNSVEPVSVEVSSEIKNYYSITQTSQVWLDYKIIDYSGGIAIHWDYVDELFPEGVLDQMFNAFTGMIEYYSKDNSDWDKNILDDILMNQIEIGSEVHNAKTEVSEKLMYELFVDNVKKYSNKIAIKSNRKNLTYRELYNRSRQLGEELEAAGVIQNSLVSIIMDKGWEQVVAALGVQFSGAAYLPIDASQPMDRINKLIELGEVDIVVSVPSILNSITFSKDVKKVCVSDLEVPDFTFEGVIFDKNKIEDLAYVIFTSGSTGEPKGVMIDHRGAVNTILDINERFGIGENDSCFALSSLSFDLSVYDIFGLLAAGGTVVVPDPEEGKDPSSWLKHLKEDGITLWNSVPALIQMLVEFASGSETELGLKHVLLSGDWIPVSLPERIKSMNQDVNIISLGGATEASIWSICFPIEDVDPKWKSIPYGKSLANQSFSVFNSGRDFIPSPIWVSGDLYIGGIGLAKGYWKDKEKTESSFIYHPETGERLYRTGDFGRYLPDGNIEFLGRNDSQVKIQGYRIELGEIEEALKGYPGINTAVVDARVLKTDTDLINRSKHLIAYIQREERESNDIGGLATSGNSITDKNERASFKLEKKGIRKLETESVALSGSYGDITIVPNNGFDFNGEVISFDKFSEIFNCLTNRALKDQPLPKYFYPSAGSLYPVQTYIFVPDHSVENLDRGFYYFNPANNRLYLTCSDIIPAKLEEIQNGFQLFLIGNLDAIEPLYGKYAEEFCYLEAGYMSNLLIESSPKEVGFREIEIDDEIRECFKLGNSHRILNRYICGNTLLTGEQKSNTLFRKLVPDQYSKRVKIELIEIGEIILSCIERKSYRSFTEEVIDFSSFSYMLNGLICNSFDIQTEGKRVDVYVTIKKGCVTSIEGGLYVLDISAMELVKQANEPVLYRLFSGSEHIYQESAFGIYIVGRGSREGMIASGYIGQSLMNLSTKKNIGLCAIGIVDKIEACKLFDLEQGDEILHSFLGGYVTDDQIIEIETKNQGKDLVELLKRYLGKVLPEYMIPSYFMTIEEIPLAVNGKINRKVLPDPDLEGTSLITEYVEAETDIEKKLVSIWQKVLGIEKIGILDNFFEIGGNSLKVTSFTTQVRNIFDIKLPFDLMYKKLNIKNISQFISDLESINNVIKTSNEKREVFEL